MLSRSLKKIDSTVTSSARSAIAVMLAGSPALTRCDTIELGMGHFGTTAISYLSLVVPRDCPSLTVGSGSTTHWPENSCKRPQALCERCHRHDCWLLGAVGAAFMGCDAEVIEAEDGPI